jgi:soluble lytic murein transglycosylase-like protein
MRRIGLMISRSPVARALLAGAFLAHLSAGEARGQTEEAVFAVPRLAPRSGDGVALPRPLPADQAARLRKAFADPTRSAIPIGLRDTNGAATSQSVMDENTPFGRALLGHFLAERYLRSAYRTTVDELTQWLDRWSDRPDAPDIYALLRRRAPHGAAPPPATLSLPPDPVHQAVPEESVPDSPAIPRDAALDREVHERAHSGNMAAALRAITRAGSISPAYSALLRAEVAQALFTQNRDADALEVATTAARIGAGRIGLADYIAGLAAWRLDRPSRAMQHFEAAARAELAPASVQAAAAFWAGRAHLRSHDPSGYVPWMQLAAKQGRTFYGLLARRTLGIGIGAGFAWDRETLGAADIEAVAATTEGMTAFALLQIGQSSRAEAELRRLWMLSRGDIPLGRAVMLVADKAGLFDLAAQLAALIQTEDGRPRDYARFPVPHLLPRNGFSLDPALVYAMTRLESNFDASMVSSAGARGLMQIMPATAAEISGDPSLADGLSERLHEPGLNLDLGQRYVNYLAKLDVVGGDLIRLLTCYNTGPGNFARWGPAVIDNGDPLVFIESIPTDETRAYVQHVLTYTWIYAARLHLPAPSLDELSAGAFPRFRANQGAVANAVLH